MRFWGTIALFAAMTALCFSCSQAPLAGNELASAPPQSDLVSERFRVTLAGKIDAKYEIQMDLEREDGKLKGTYFYQKPGAMSIADKYIMLAGTIDPRSNNVNLTEMDFNRESGKEFKTGEFRGRLTSVGDKESPRLSFSGTWTRARDNKSLPFDLTEILPELGPSLALAEEKTSDRNKAKHYELETNLPRLKGTDTIRATKFNRVVDAFVSKQIKEFKELVAEEAKTNEPQLRTSEVPNSLEIGHSVTSSNDRYISLLFTFFSYTGGAHPNTNTGSLNYDLEKGEVIGLASLFKPGSKYLPVISDYCITELDKLKIGDSDWIRRGAGPKEENFRSWNITSLGLMITFDAYQVASYAEGPQEVVVPFAVLKDVVKPDGLLSR